MPHPRSGFRLNHRVIDPSLDDAVIERSIAAGHVVGPGTYDVLEGYPLQLWAWPAGAPPHQECDLQLNTTGLTLTPVQTGVPRLQRLSIEAP